VVNLWIGPPERMREIPDTATDFDRSVDLGVTEFSALGGGVTTTSLVTPPRRLALSWTGLRDTDARWLEALARRVFGPRPLAVIDPTAINLLDGPQSQGYAPRTAWGTAGPGTLAQRADRVITVTGTTQGASQLFLRHPLWIGWPVVPGLPISFTSALTERGALCRIEFFDADSVFVGGPDPAPVVTALPPPGAVFALPKINLPTLATSTPVGSAVLRLGDPITPGEAAPIGDGCPAMVVTSYTDKPRWPNRDLALSLVEVRRATG